MTCEEFLGRIIAELIQNGVSIVIRRYKNTSKYCYCSFDGNVDKPVFTMVYKNHREMKDLFPTFLHEYCHFLQWKEDINRWNENTEYIYKLHTFFESDETELDINIVQKIRAMELDCDRRVIDILLENKFEGIDVSEYIKESNLYILCYKYFVKNKQIDYVPYRKKDVYAALPDHHMSLEEFLVDTSEMDILYQYHYLKYQKDKNY